MMKINRNYAAAVLFSAIAGYIAAVSPLMSQVSNPGTPTLAPLPTNGDCAKFVVSGGSVQGIQTNGTGCATPVTPGGLTGNVQTNNGSGGFAGLTNTQLTAQINAATASLSGALPAWPNNTTTYFRGDGSYATLNFAALGGSAACGQLPALTGDATSTGCAVTLATVNANVGSWGDSTHVGAVTVNAKGLVTGASSVAIAFPVTTVFGRSGAVVAATNDYNFNQLAGSATLSQLPQMNANSFYSNFTGSAAQPLNNSFVACANDGGHAWVYVNGTGIQCETITAGSGTVTNVATSGLATGGPITGTGTVTVTAAAKTDQQAATSNVLAVTPLHQQDHPSAQKAWVTFSGSASPVINASYNVSSVTQNATGDYTIHFTTAFVGNYVCTGMVGTSGASAGIFSAPYQAAPGASAYRVGTFGFALTNVDFAYTNVICAGTQ